MTFEEFKQEGETKKIEITRNEFTRKAAEVAATDESIKGLIKTKPALLMAFGFYTAAIARALFYETEEENQEE